MILNLVKLIILKYSINKFSSHQVLTIHHQQNHYGNEKQQLVIQRLISNENVSSILKKMKNQKNRFNEI
jgi:hypothetical protein